MRCITYDYNKNLKTEYIRMGACNHCGECCKVVIYLDDTPKPLDCRQGCPEINRKGVWHQYQSVWFKVRIDLDADWNHGCWPDGCHPGHQGKGLICAAWPLHPNHAIFDDCSYRFYKLSEEKIYGHIKFRIVYWRTRYEKFSRFCREQYEHRFRRSIKEFKEVEKR